MTKLIRAPNEVPEPTTHEEDTGLTVFLAGTCKAGIGDVWRQKVTSLIENHAKVARILDPRRPDWQPHWSATADDPEFCRQVKWEHDGLGSEVIFFAFDPATPAPITLMELGYVIGRMAFARALDGEEINGVGFGPNQHITVYCPDGYMHKGNVVLMCERLGVPVHNTMRRAVEDLHEGIDLMHALKGEHLMKLAESHIMGDMPPPAKPKPEMKKEPFWKRNQMDLFLDQ